MTTICHLLREDRDLAAAVPEERRESALHECLAPVQCLPAGRWAGGDPAALAGGIGMLVLSGLLVRGVGVQGRYAAELLGQGALLRAGSQGNVRWSLPRTTRWRVLGPARLALLDRRATRRISKYPGLTQRLVARALEQADDLAVNMAIVHQARVDVRLQMLFWQLVDRWGRVGPDGVVLPLSLTHAALADLVAARRPTVTAALSELARSGVVCPVPGGWLLRGGPPGELLELSAANACGRLAVALA